MNLVSNGLVIADLHIKKDERFAPEGTTNYRLEAQPMMLIDRMEEIMEEERIGWIALLGDLLDTSSCLPQELHVLDKFFGRMNNWRLPILVILGQHDVDTNRYDDNNTNYFDRSNVTALIEHYNNIHYAHNMYGIINNKYKYWMSNFSEPLIYPKEYVDLWLTHCSLGFTHVEEYNTNANQVKLDRKFGMMVAGDIHMCAQYGNCYTVGTPYQHKAHEEQIGVIGLIKDNGKELEFSRILSDTPRRQFLKFDPPMKELKIKNDLGEEIKIETHNILDEIDNKVKELGLEHIHNKISKAGAPNPVNLNFRLKTLYIENYKSCKKLELDFTSFKKTLFLQGKYGSGKSTVVEALRDVFFGDTKTIDAKVKYGEKNCRLQVDFEYEGKDYTIVRGKSLLEFYINGNMQTATNMKGLEALMNLTLPFIKYLYLFLPHSNERLFDPEKGLELFQRCFNLDMFDYYLDSAVKLKKLYNEENNALFNNVKVKEGERNILQAEVDRLKNYVEEAFVNTEGDVNKLKSEWNELKEHCDTIVDLERNIQANKSLIKDIENEDELRNQINKSNQKIALLQKEEKKKQEKAVLERELQNTREQYALLNKQIKEVEIPSETEVQLIEKKNRIDEENNKNRDIIASLKSKIVTLQGESKGLEMGIKKGNYTCPTCGQQVVKDVSGLKERLDEIVKLIKKNETELANVQLIDTKDIDLQLEAHKIIKRNDEIKLQLDEIKKAGNMIKVKVEAIIINEDGDLDTEIRILNSLNAKLKDIENNKEIEKRIIELEATLNIMSGKYDFDVTNRMTELEEQINKHTIYENYKNELGIKQKDLDDCMATIDELSEEYNRGVEQLTQWDLYISLMDYNNLESIPYKLINLLITNFNTDRFKINTSKTQKNGKEKFMVDLAIRDENSKYWVPYVSQSGGQKLLSDLYLYDSIAKFMGGIGILSLDENLNTASIDLYPLLNDIIGNLSYNNVILVSHSQQISSYDKKITVYLNDKHESQYE